MYKPGAFIFDIDGTLVNSMPVLRAGIHVIGVATTLEAEALREDLLSHLIRDAVSWHSATIAVRHGCDALLAISCH